MGWAGQECLPQTVLGVRRVAQAISLFDAGTGVCLRQTSRQGKQNRVWLCVEGSLALRPLEHL
jgi:hypothetical protein